MMRISVAALITASLVAMTWRSAEACTPPPPGFAGSMPPEGSTVPANAVWFVQGYDVAPVSGYWLDWDVFIPLRVEEVGRTYELHNDFGRYPPFDGVELYAEAGNDFVEPLRTSLNVVDREDTMWPELQEDLDLQVELLPDEPGLCQQGGYHVTVTVSAAFDEFGIGAYHLYEVTGNQRAWRFSRLGHVGVIRARINLHAYEGTQPGRRCYVVDAVDFAGNIARGSRETCIELDGGGIDAGVIDSGIEPADSGITARDAGSTEVPSTRPSGLDLSQGRGCGCSVDRERSSSSSFGLALVLGAALVIRRRRST